MTTAKSQQSKPNKETMQFQTEVNQLLNLMVHSLYSNREIFLRELISNASDALDKRRYEGLTDATKIEGQGDARIRLSFDEDNKTITIKDNGIGMSRGEVIENIGTIAKSGTKKFIEQLQQSEKEGNNTQASNLIGQFGVGFYSAFIVADKVTLYTRKAGSGKDEGVRWESQMTNELSDDEETKENNSNQTGAFTLESLPLDRVGTEITLTLNKEHYDLLNEWTLKSIVKKYSNHIAYPILMDSKKEIPKLDEEGKPLEAESEIEVTEEQINSATTLWQRDRSTIKEEEYQDFYKQLTHDYEAPLTWSHNRVEGNYSYTSLLYIPTKAPMGFWQQEADYGIQLYVQRVFIMDGSEKLIPRYLRFMKGIVDTQDLPLNVSREILQASKTIDTLRQGLTRRSLNMLESLAKSDEEGDKEKYTQFWGQFGRVLKEGVGEDFANQEKIAGLLRFSTTHSDDPIISLDSYIERMQEGQDKIYFITADSLNTAKNSPHLEIFKQKGYEVLLMTDVVDDWMMGFLNQYKDYSFSNVAKGEINLNADKEEESKEETALTAEEEALVGALTENLKDEVDSVKISKRLTTSASCLVRNEGALSSHFEQMLKDAGHEVPTIKPWLEVNANHFLVKAFLDEKDKEKKDDYAQLLYEEALLLEGGKLDNPSLFIERINRLMGKPQ